jgi:hypothetical protein
VINFAVAANTGPIRVGTMSVAGFIFSVRQTSDCEFTISPGSQNFPASGGTGTVGITTAPGCTWAGVLVSRNEPELPRVFIDTTYVQPLAAPTFVPAGADLQAALDAAQPGDVLALQAGATFTGNFSLPAKPGAGWITIRSSAPDSSLPPPGTRINPGYAGVMPKLVTPNGGPALEIEDGAHHFRLIGVEITMAPSVTGLTSLVLLGDNDQTTLAALPHNLILDRVYIHGNPTTTLRRGVAFNAINSAIIDSYISDCHELGIDSQAILVWNTPGPIKIVNNYLEGAAENIMFGGADPRIANLIPSDIEFRRNHCFKPLTWKVDDPSYAGIPWSVKNLFELKNAQRVLVEGNIFENNWAESQAGFAIVLTSRNEEWTAPWSAVRDVTFINNIVRHAGSGININGQDDLKPSQPTKRIRISNNLFEDIDGIRWGNADGRHFQFVGGPDDIIIEHNTGFQSDNLSLIDGDPPGSGFVFRNNLVPSNTFGLFGSGVGQGTSALDHYFPGYIFRRNVIVGGQSVLYPPDNLFPATFGAVGFVNFAAGNYRLAPSSPFKNAATTGKDIGCDFDALNAALISDKAPQVATNDDWITITSGGSGSGSGAVSYSVAANTGGPARTGTILVAGRTFTVTQDSGCSFSLDRSSESFTSDGGTASVTVTASAGGCFWPATSNVAWITITSGAGGAGNGPMTFSVEPTVGPTRIGTLTIAGHTFTVMQSAGNVGMMYYPLPRPVRLLDTRPGESGCFAPAAPLGNNAVRTQVATGTCNGVTIPSTAIAVVGNATVVNFISTGFNWITLYPSNAAQPNASVLNFTENQIVANQFTVGLGPDGAFNIYSRASTNFIVDITGYYAPPGPGGLYYHPLPAPIRLFDSRPGETACDAPGAPLGSGGTRTVTGHGTCLGTTIPSSAKAIAGNATVVNFISSNFNWITLYPFGTAQPNASNVNFNENQIVPNAFVTTLSGDGKFNIFSSSSTHFIVDVTGYYSGEAMDTNGLGLLYVPLPSPVRLLDTRPGETGCDAPGAPLGSDATRTQLAHRTCLGVTIPSTAKAVDGNATVVNFISTGFNWITLFPFGATQPNASNLNFHENHIVPNAFVVGLSRDGKFNIYSRAATHFIVDLTGYFAP